MPPLTQWAIEVRDTGTVVGWACLVPIPNSDGLIQIGWTLHPDAHGHGYASEAARVDLALTDQWYDGPSRVCVAP